LDFQVVGIEQPSIHMRFVFTLLAVVWLADEGKDMLRVIDVTLADPGGRGYRPRGEARYALEARSEVTKRLRSQS
jgi:hypothetical protein